MSDDQKRTVKDWAAALAGLCWLSFLAIIVVIFFKINVIFGSLAAAAIGAWIFSTIAEDL